MSVDNFFDISYVTLDGKLKFLLENRLDLIKTLLATDITLQF